MSPTKTARRSRRNPALAYGRNRTAVNALLDLLKSLSAADYRRIDDASLAILTPLFGHDAPRVIHPARAARVSATHAARDAAWRIATHLDVDPEYRGSRIAAEVAAFLTFADLVSPERLAAVRSAFCAALTGHRCELPFELIRPRRRAAA